MNSINLVGRIGGDAELRYTTGGLAVANVNLAIDRGKKDGEKRPALWIKIVLWAKQAEALAKYLLKGKLIAVTGELADPEAWVSKEDGSARSRVVITARNITLLGGGERQAETESGNEPEPPPVTDEDIPF